MDQLFTAPNGLLAAIFAVVAALWQQNRGQTKKIDEQGQEIAKFALAEQKCIGRLDLVLEQLKVAETDRDQVKRELAEYRERMDRHHSENIDRIDDGKTAINEIDKKVSVVAESVANGTIKELVDKIEDNYRHTKTHEAWLQAIHTALVAKGVDVKDIPGYKLGDKPGA